MQSSTFKALLLFALFSFFAFSSAFANNDPAPFNPPCPAPAAPTNLVVTAVTATTITVAWTAPGAPFFQAVAVDLATATAYGSSGTGNTTTFTGLQPGRLHQISVRVSSCEQGDYSEEARTEGTTGIIIIDMVGGFQQGSCTPNNLFNGPVHELCVKKSTFSSSPYENESRGRITIGLATCNFAFAYTDQNGSLPKLVVVPLNMSAGFDFQVLDPSIVKCTYNSTDVFRVSPQNMTATDAKAVISFLPGFTSFGGTYTYCSRCVGEGNSGGGGRSMSDGDSPALTSTNAETSILVSPNPFTDNAHIQYNLTVPTLVSIQLYDAIGRPVHTVQPNTLLEAGEYTATVQGSSLPKGSYFAVIQKGGQRQVISLVKQD